MTTSKSWSSLVNVASIAVHFASARWRWHHLRTADLEYYQDRQARRIVAYTAEHSPFYHNHWAGYDLADWRTLPTVDKQTMMDNFSTFTTRGISKESALQVALQAERSRNFRPLLNGFTVGLSSGTSGHRGLFIASPQEQAAWAGTILARTLHDFRLRRLHVAFFLRSNNNLYEQVGKGLLRFRYFDLMLPLSEAVERLNALQPHILIGPPSLLGFLADERRAGRLRIRPERLISVAEVLEAQDHERLQNMFNVPVHQIYQCTEGFLAASCVRGTLHIQEDIVALQFEPIAGDAENRVTPIVTDLWRRTQPIIRYRLNDILQLDPAPCSCGSPFRAIRVIEGRSDDVCYFTSSTGQPRPFFPDTLRRMVLLASLSIADYQIIQPARDQLTIYLSLIPEASFETVKQSLQASVAATLAQYDCLPATLQVMDGLPLLPTEKKRRRVQKSRNVAL
ncbi:MAG: adenylate cyclase [Ktedonobacteraceae bacterium]|nr:adenylate cyclase [Ktedonobacteraceae bacterium]